MPSVITIENYCITRSAIEIENYCTVLSATTIKNNCSAPSEIVIYAQNPLIFHIAISNWLTPSLYNRDRNAHPETPIQKRIKIIAARHAQ